MKTCNRCGKTYAEEKFKIIHNGRQKSKSISYCIYCHIKTYKSIEPKFRKPDTWNLPDTPFLTDWKPLI